MKLVVEHQICSGIILKKKEFFHWSKSRKIYRQETRMHTPLKKISVLKIISGYG